MNGRKHEINVSITIVVEPDGDEFHAYCPALKGLHAPGSTAEEACENAASAAVAYVESLLKHGDPIPIGAVSGELRPGAVHCLRTRSVEFAYA